MFTAAKPAHQSFAPTTRIRKKFNLLAYLRALLRAGIGEMLCLTAGELS